MQELKKPSAIFRADDWPIELWYHRPAIAPTTPSMKYDSPFQSCAKSFQIFCFCPLSIQHFDLPQFGLSKIKLQFSHETNHTLKNNTRCAYVRKWRMCFDACFSRNYLNRMFTRSVSVRHWLLGLFRQGALSWAATQALVALRVYRFLQQAPRFAAAASEYFQRMQDQRLSSASWCRPSEYRCLLVV